MSGDDAGRDQAIPPGEMTGATGTPVPVDRSRDRRWRVLWLAFLVGPVIWITHFAVVYLVGEAGCTGDGVGLDGFDPPVTWIATIVATVVAAVACIAAAVWSGRLWRDSRDGVLDGSAGAHGRPADEPDEVEAFGALAFTGSLLSWLSLLAVLFVGLPALVFTGC